MQAGDQARLVDLLDRLVRDGGVLPRLPAAVFEIIGHVVPLVAVEIGITRAGGEILLTHRRDRQWNGWHLPGGFLGVRETLPAACNRIAGRELGVDVTLHRVVDIFCWPDHPLGSVLSVVCHCEAGGVPRTGEWCKGLRESMIRYHAEFAARCLANASK
ncbi:MAG: NUDIX hydrolase [Gammaproteobacteria bacterium]